MLKIKGNISKIAVFHGSPRKGNTYHAAKIFMGGLRECGDIHFTEFFLPEALPVFCKGCTLCFGSPYGKCPHASYVTPIYESIIEADALLLATPHYGACGMTGAMKNLLDHLDFLVMNISPREEIFHKKAFIITTAAGSAAAIPPIKKFLKHWGINRVYSMGIRMFTNKWDTMPKAKQEKFEKALRRFAVKFYKAPERRPYLSTIFHYYLTRYIIRKYVGEGNYPYEYWKEKGYFRKRPF